MEEPQNSAPRRVEAYLDTVLASLPRRLSAFQLEELRRELRTHLWERVAAYEELGQTEDEAVTEALTQFGGGQDFLKQWRREWKKPTKRMTAREVWEATRSMLRPTLTSLAVVVPLPFVLLRWYFYGLHGSPSTALTVGTWVWFWCALLLLPIWVGIKQWRGAPGRAGIGIAAVLGIAAALTAEIAAAGLLSQFADWLLPTGSPDRIVADGFFGLLLSLLLVWLPLASGAAAVTGWWTRRSEGQGTRPLRLD